MNPPPIQSKPRLSWPSLLIAFLCALPAVAFGADDSTKRPFNIPAGAAESSLRQFAEQATGVQFFFSAGKVSGARTRAIDGKYGVREALELMLDGSGLVVAQDEKTGALTVQRPAREAAPGAAAPRNGANARNPESGDDIVRMTPFEVSSDRDSGYLKTNSITTSRIGVPIIKEPASIEIISSELLKDFSVTDFDKVFRYSSGVVTGETEVGQAGIFTMRGFHMYRYFNGVPLADSFSITPLLLTDNIDRIEIAKGAVGLFYGNALPNGVANYISKKPQFTKASSLSLTYGSSNLTRALVDIQDKINPSTAYRLITSYQSKDGRYEDEHRDYIFIAPSVVFRPNDKIEVTAEYNYTKSHATYPVFDWHLVFNPDYLRDVSNPSQEIIDYMQTAYNLADDDAARALINQRWNSGPFRSYVMNWSEDIYGMTGRQPYPNEGSTIDWWRLSPLGDRWTSASKESTQNGSTSLVDVGVTLTPQDNQCIR